MINNEEHLKEIVEAIKQGMNLEELDELERKYNEMYKVLKEKEEQRKASTTKED
jgi:methionine aminopeptidase